MTRRACVGAAALLAVTWPAWSWYAARLGDGSDEPWGLLALVTLVLVLARARQAEPGWLPAAAVLAVYAASYPLLPDMGRAALALAAGVAYLRLPPGGARVGAWGLAALSLPVIASMQFYLGYPLRHVVAVTTASLLSLSGVGVSADGAALAWAGGTVLVDAPCSGVRMLWTSLYVACVLCCARRFSTRQAAAVLGVSCLAALAGNVVRASSLFFVATAPLPPWMHDAVGLVAFALVVLWTAGFAGWMGGGAEGGVRPGKRADAGPPSAPSAARPGVLLPFLLACLAAALAPAQTSAPPPPLVTGFPGWPATFEGRPLHPRPLTDIEKRYEAGFPGRIGRFTDGTRELVLRWVARPTRLLHPASDCFRGAGYPVSPGAAAADSQGRLWQRFTAARDGGDILAVRECILAGSLDGSQSWPDVSEWYWSALLGRSRGPWWAVTVVEPR